MRVTVGTVQEGTPELSRASWVGVGGRAICLDALIAHASALADPMLVAAVWDDADGAPRGLAVGVLFTRGAERWLEISRGVDTEDAVLTRVPDDVEAIRALIGALIEHARRREVVKLLLGHVRADRAGLLSVAEDFGFRLLAADGYELRLAAGAGFEAYLAGLDRKPRNWMRRDLRRLDEAGATMHASTPPPALTSELWSMYLRLIARKNAPTDYNSNFLDALLARAAPDSVSLAWCTRGGATLGYALGLRDGDTAWLLHLGHVDVPDLQTYVAMGAWWIREEIARGARTLSFSILNDRWKRRLGCEAVAHRWGFRRL